jgi:hypothetical protein
METVQEFFARIESDAAEVAAQAVAQAFEPEPAEATKPQLPEPAAA